MEKDFVYGTIQKDALCLNPAELAARLQAEKGFTNDLVAHCKEQLFKALDCRYAAKRIKVQYREDAVDLTFAKVNSHALSRNLQGCQEAIVFAITLGMGVERLLNRLSLLSEAEFFITDALASATAEAVCDYAEAELAKGLVCRPRFSPGYGDLELNLQPEIVKLINGQKLLGITLTPSLLMVPTKSITAIMGVCHEESTK